MIHSTRMDNRPRHWEKTVAMPTPMRIRARDSGALLLPASAPMAPIIPMAAWLGSVMSPIVTKDTAIGMMRMTACLLRPGAGRMVISLCSRWRSEAGLSVGLIDAPNRCSSLLDVPW